MHIYNSHRGQLGLHLPSKLLVDNFAGGGGASTAMEMAFGRPVDIAINHDPEAIGMHKINHPDTEHYCESVWDVDPVKACMGREVEWAHFSPDCTHHSKARGGKPKKKEIRGLAWIVIKWAILKKPENISLENVEEFKSWGPLNSEGHPIKERINETFDAFIKMLTTGINKDHPAVAELKDFMPEGMDISAVYSGLDYSIGWNEVIASHNNAPTTRKRLFMVAKRDGSQIHWAEPTHGKPNSIEVKTGKLKPFRTAAECIDWSIPVKSIFNRKRPLAENTMKRIACGLMRFIIDEPYPFIAPIDAAPFITECANASNQRNMRINEPLRTITAQTKGGTFALVTASLEKRKKAQSNPQNNVLEVRAFLLKYYGNEKDGLRVDEPLHTITTNDRFGLVTALCNDYEIVDIGMRMLKPHELYAAQSFPPGYIHDRTADGKKLTQTAQVRMCGNSVAPEPFAALIRANINNSVPMQEKAA